MTKITAALLAVMLMLTCAGCGGDQSWSYQSDVVSLTAGTYIYNLLNAYYEAYDLVESADEADDILECEITDSDGSTTTVEQYTYDAADDYTVSMLAVEQLMLDLGLELDEDEYSSALSYASQFWGSYYKDTFEGYGISQDSFNYAYAEYSVKYGQVFETMYGTDADGNEGEKYVADDELVEFYKENYTGYAYFGESGVTEDDDGNSVVMEDEELEAIQERMQKCVDALNSGVAYTEAVAEYCEDAQLTSDPTYSGSESLTDPSLSDDILNAYTELDEGEAVLIQTGEDDTTYFYVVYKPVTDDIIDFLDSDTDSDTDTDADTEESADTTEDETSDTDTDTEDSAETEDTASEEVYIYDLKTGYTHYSLLSEMKGDEFDDYLVEFGNELSFTKNEYVIDKFKAKMFVD